MRSIAIDGPAGSGKSTIAQLLAQALGIHHLDTGAMYRALSYFAHEQNISEQNEDALLALAESMHFTIENNQLQLNGHALPEGIRDNQHAMGASTVSAFPKIRAHMQEKQRALAKQSALILDGRDIGTYVLPESPYKFYIDASVDVRARRRWKQKNLPESDYQQVYDDLVERDRRDRDRTIAPLKIADDATIIDNTNLNAEETVSEMQRVLEEKQWS